jgi:glyoxylase-like metal-dependent hydrolase (beta-lactamase superfamily II)
MTMKFSQEDEPVRHIAQELAEDISRIVAINPSRMTYHGTNTYLLRSGAGWVVIDPGPLDNLHTADIMAATGGDIIIPTMPAAQRP